MGAISEQDFDNASDRLNEAKASLAAALEVLNKQENGYREEDILQAKADLANKEALLKSAEIKLEDTKLYSPSSGTILTRAIETGTILNSGQIVYSISLDEPVWIRTNISEPDLGKVEPGQEVKVFTDSRKEPYTGQIGYISPKAEFTPKNVETTELRADLVYRMRINIQNDTQGLRQGMPVTIKIPNVRNSTRDK